MAKQSGNVAAKVEALVRPVIEGLGLRLWDIRYEKEGPEWFLRVFIDRDEPLDTDTCEIASRAVDPILDEADLIEQSYYLEVGSPGLGRKLTRPEHFEYCIGQKIFAQLYKPNSDGQKKVEGILEKFEDDTAFIQAEGGLKEVKAADAGYFKLCDDENLFG